MNERRADVAIVGGGILGLAHAYAVASRGRSVVLFERHAKATGASVRNFGMIWPVGQAAGANLQLALHSRELWRAVLDHARIPYSDTGSLHVAYRKDEADVAREFAEVGVSRGYQCAWLDREAALARSGAIVSEGLIGALWSATEMTVDPRSTVGNLPTFLAEQMGVQFRYESPVLAIELPRIETSTECWMVDAAIVCSGDEMGMLYPALLGQAGLIRSKLQMMRTGPQPGDWLLGPSLAAGLTLRFYPAFQICTTLDLLRQRIAEEMPELDRWGIHALVSQAHSGELTIGDSHEYGDALGFVDKPIIDELILGYTRSFLQVPDLTVAERWHGFYVKHATQAYVSIKAAPCVRIVTGTGGAGMTLSFGIAEKTVREMNL